MRTKTDTPFRPTRKAKPALSFEPPTPGARSGIGVAPLVDIVFLLICFYLFVTQSIQAHEDPSIELPVMTNQALAAEVPAELVVNVAADGSIKLNSLPVGLDDLRAILGEQQRLATQRDQTLSVVVRIDRRQPYRRLDQVLEACRRVGMKTPLVRTTEGEVP